MAKHKLLLEDDFEFDLIGICSNQTDYRLCWAINKSLKISLEKVDDFEVRLKKDGDNKYSFYEFYDEVNHLEYYLVKNMSNNFKRLIPEKDQIDYFLIIKNNFAKDVDEMVSSLKEVESVLTAFSFVPDELKSKSNLVF